MMPILYPFLTVLNHLDIYSYRAHNIKHLHPLNGLNRQPMTMTFKRKHCQV